MAERDTQPIEPEEPAAGAGTPSSKGRQSFRKVRRTLSDEELSSPVANKMLLDEVDRLERELTETAGCRDKYFDAEIRARVLEERVKKTVASDVMFGTCLTVGAAIMGLAPSLWNSQPAGWLALVVGFGLIAGGVAFRVVQR